MFAPGDKDEESKDRQAKKLKTDEKKENGSVQEASDSPPAAGKAPAASSEGARAGAEPQPSTSAAADEAEKLASETPADEKTAAESNVYICQYCDREFPTSKLLIAHELQHLIGNHFEVSRRQKVVCYHFETFVFFFCTHFAPQNVHFEVRRQGGLL